MPIYSDSAQAKTGSYSYRFACYGTPAYLVYTFSPAYSGPVRCGAYFRFPGSQSGEVPLLQFRSASASLVTLYWTAASGLLVARDGGGSLLATATIACLVDTWVHLEAQLDPGSGLIVRWNGIPIVTWSGTTDDIGELRLGVVASVLAYFWADDVVVSDAEGTVNNEWLGPTRVEYLQPNADGHYGDWNREPSGAASDYSVVAENEANDSNYLYTTAAGVVSLQLADLSADKPVLAIQTVSRLFLDAVGIGDTTVILRDNNTDHQVVTHSPTPTPAWYTHILEEHPNSGPWDQTALNDLELGYEVT